MAVGSCIPLSINKKRKMKSEVGTVMRPSLGQRFRRPVDAIRHKWRRLVSYRNVGPTGYAVRQVNPWVFLAFILSLGLWVGQELWLRELFPVDGFKRLNRAFDILSVVWGSFFTGYVFHLIVDHLPKKREEYRDLRAIELELASILLSHQKIICCLLVHIPKDETLDLSIYDQGRRTHGIQEKLGEVWPQAVKEIGTDFIRLNADIRKLKEEKQFMPFQVRRVVDKANEFAWQGEDLEPYHWDAETAAMRLELLMICCSAIFSYCVREHMAGRVMEPLMDHVLSEANYLALWIDPEELPF